MLYCTVTDCTASGVHRPWVVPVLTFFCATICREISMSNRRDNIWWSTDYVPSNLGEGGASVIEQGSQEVCDKLSSLKPWGASVAAWPSYIAAGCACRQRLTCTSAWREARRCSGRAPQGSWAR